MSKKYYNIYGEIYTGINDPSIPFHNIKNYDKNRKETSIISNEGTIMYCAYPSPRIEKEDLLVILALDEYPYKWDKDKVIEAIENKMFLE